MKLITNFLKFVRYKNQFNSIKIKLASDKKIRSWSYGEVKKSETINYRTFRPEKSGLFCSKIFGPVKNYECLCGKYKRVKYCGVICEKCGVEVTLTNVRRERMGHITLAAPVAHIWFLKSLPSRLSIILNMNLKDIEKVLYFEKYVIINPGKSFLKKKQVISENVYIQNKERYKKDFLALMGAEGIQKLLSSINIKKNIKNLKKSLKNLKSNSKVKKLLRRLKIFEALKKSNMKPQWIIMKILPVLPSELRPLVLLEGGRFATSDLNDLYRRIINRNNRLKKLINLKAPEIILKNEKRMLQEAVDALFDNGRSGKVILGSNKRPLKSLSEMIKGKTGRFRQNLLGKRVDYSGRSVIIVGPELDLHQCGLPRLMALELFKPFILQRLNILDITTDLQFSKKLIDSQDPIILEILEDIIKEHPVILNRAPTLHRLGIQAFKAVLIEGKAIKLHPLVCAAFNADFDGDQMAVHIPLSIEAQSEALSLMMSDKNILFPSNGEPSITPTQDIILGLYYATQKFKNIEDEKIIFSDVHEVIVAYNNKVVDLFTNIILRVYEKENYKDKKNLSYVYRRYSTTVGRVMLYEIFPKNLSFSLINKIINKKKISKIISIIFFKNGIKKTVSFVNKLTQYGFKMATISGMSISINDMKIPKEKNNIISISKKKINKINKQYSLDLITKKERYNKIIDIWSKTTENVSKIMIYEMEKTYKKNSYKKNFLKKDLNPIYIMINSGARGSSIQIRQLAGMRGLMSKPDNSIIETPIISNFREGLDVLQYFISTHGARKGLSDTALKTANSGYLTRRLVDVTQDLIILKYDCFTKKGIKLKSLIENGKVIESLKERILGRVSLEDIVDYETKEIICNAGTLIDEDIIEKINFLKINSIKVRSPLKCKIRYGLCVKCYGRDLSKGVLVNVGEAVGIIAAQSIGEPGTQLTMRTFHIGGATSRVIVDSFIKTKVSGKILFSSSMRCILNSKNNLIVISRFGKIFILDKFKNKIEQYKIPYGAILLINNNDLVKIGEKLAFWDSLARPIIAENSGFIKFKNFFKNLTVEKKFDSLIKSNIYLVIGSKKINKKKHFEILRPQINILNEFKNCEEKKDVNKFTTINFLIGTKIIVKNKQFVKVGDVIAYIPVNVKKTLDITGGLPKVAELFEARISKNSAILAEITGNIFFDKDIKNKQSLNIISSDGIKHNFLVSKNKQILVHDGQFINKGEIIVEGPINPQDILRLLGINKLIKYIVNEVQIIYRSQGVKINEKHIEIIIKQMLRKVEIISPGDTDYIVGEQVEKYELLNINDNIILKNKLPATYIPVLLGITKASLSTDSFISAASFQETTRILTEAAILGKEDNLRGLKENVIVGRLVPAGTGFIFHKFKEKIFKKKSLFKKYFKYFLNN